MGIRERIVFRPADKPVDEIVTPPEEAFHISSRGDKKGNSPEILEGKENERIRYTARCFMFQSRSLQEIRDEIVDRGLDALKDLELTHCVFLQKRPDSKNPNQWMPPGGKIETGRGETAGAASMREAYEEFGVRSPSGHVFQGKYLYSLPSDAGLNRSFIFAGRIMPSDKPWPIDNQEDKIGEITPFGHRDLTRLMTQGQFADQKRKGELLDSLQIGLQERSLMREAEEGEESGERKLHGFVLDKNRVSDAFKINIGIMDFSAGQEAGKKLEILKLFLTKMKVIFLRSGDEVCAGVNPITGQKLSANLVEWKKLWISHLSWLSGESSESGDPYKSKDNTEFLGKVERVWKNIFEVLESVKSGAIKKRIATSFERAVDLGNFKEEIAGEYSAGSKIEAVLHFLYTLSASDFFDDSYLRIAKKNDKLKDFVGRLEEFFRGIPNPPGETAEQVRGAGVYRKMNYIGKMGKNRDYLDRIGRHFAKVFGIPSGGQEFDERRGYVNDFLDHIAETAAKVDESGSNAEESMLNELRTAKLSDLVYWAFSPDDAPSKRSEKGDVDSGQYTLDARRHLVLMYLMNGVEQFIKDQDMLSKDWRGQTEDKIETDIFGEMLSSPSGRVFFRKVFKDEEKYKATGAKIVRSVLVDIEQVPENVAGTFAKTTRHMKRTRAGSEYKLEVDTSNRIKKRPSIYRKTVERGLDEMYEEDGTPVITDRARRTIVVHQCPKDKIRRINFSEDDYVEAGLINPDKKIGIDNQTEIEAVLDVMKGIVDAGKVRGKNAVRIIKYKPTPRLGERMQSSTVGAAGDVRLAKFVIEYTELDKKGKPVKKDGRIVKRYEEVQVFSPSTDGRTATFWKEDKKIKDVPYVHDRLYNTMKRALRSPVVLLLGRKAQSSMTSYLAKHASERKKLK